MILKQIREAKTAPLFSTASTSSCFLDNLLTAPHQPRQPEPCTPCPPRRWEKCRGRLAEEAMHPDSLTACGALCKPLAMSPELLATGELAGAQLGQGFQEQLKEMETAVVSPVCSGKSFWGLEKGAGWPADWSRVRPGR